MNNAQQQVLFITDRSFVEYTIPGGIQLCTREFITYLTKAGYHVQLYTVVPKVSFISKVKNRIGIEAYDLYNIDSYLDDLVNNIVSNNIRFVFFNQLNLVPVIEKIRGKVPVSVKFIGLSHGNESGDHLHDITNGNRNSFLSTWRLGQLLVKEKNIYTRSLDGVLTISNHETYIDQWIGAQKTCYLPRILRNEFISWLPMQGVVGFVGTLNHLPNLGAIKMLSRQLQEKGFNGELRIVGGPEKVGYELAQTYPFLKYCGQLTSAQLTIEAGSWTIFINPIFWYARGSSTKLAQGLNWGLPVLSTPAGARGYELHNTEMLTPDNTPAKFADTIIALLESPAAIENLKQATKENVAHFNTGYWANKLPEFLNSL